jgi:hypothetical protein
MALDHAAVVVDEREIFPIEIRAKPSRCSVALAQICGRSDDRVLRPFVRN